MWTQDFASGYLFGQLFDSLGLQPDFGAFVNKGKPDACLANHTRLQVRLRGSQVQRPRAHAPTRSSAAQPLLLEILSK
jgi:hypothetical protein